MDVRDETPADSSSGTTVPCRRSVGRVQLLQTAWQPRRETMDAPRRARGRPSRLGVTSRSSKLVQSGCRMTLQMPEASRRTDRRPRAAQLTDARPANGKHSNDETGHLQKTKCDGGPHRQHE